MHQLEKEQLLILKNSNGIFVFKGSFLIQMVIVLILLKK